MEKYITRDEYLEAKGIDLSIELQDNDNRSHKVERFIKETTDWCISHLARHYGDFKLITDWDSLRPVQQEYFRKGIIEQIEYILDNGWISKDSGLNTNTGIIVDLHKIALGSNAKNMFWYAGLLNI